MSVNPFTAAAIAPTPQLAYVDTPAAALLGQLADMTDHEVVSRIFPAGVALFGTLMVNDLTVEQGVLYSSTTLADGVAGFVVRTAAIESRRDLVGAGYPAQDMVNIARKGTIWTASEVAVTKHNKVFVRVTANGALNTLGALRNDADTASAVEVVGARWADTAAAGAPARIEFNFLGL